MNREVPEVADDVGIDDAKVLEEVLIDREPAEPA